LIGWVGRLSREKGADLFVEALGQVADLPWDAVIIGEGGERAALEARAAALGLTGRVHWLGLVPDAGRAMAAFDGFVLSSRTEGTPIALLEAMAAAVPTVATTVGGVPDVISDGEAWLVPPASPGRLAGALRELLTAPGLAAGRGRAGRERLLQGHGGGPWLDRHEALYRSLLDRDRRA
jgi:glycosyltransferase involved in cell wall biosynthesis